MLVLMLILIEAGGFVHEPNNSKLSKAKARKNDFFMKKFPSGL